MVVPKSSINMLARMDAIDYDNDSYKGVEVPPTRYEVPYMQELYEQYFWNNLREIRGEHCV